MGGEGKYLNPVWPPEIDILMADNFAVVDPFKSSWELFCMIKVDSNLEIYLLRFIGGRVIDHGLQFCNTTWNIPLDGNGHAGSGLKGRDDMTGKMG